jgi:hypothetical protein
VSHIFPNSVFPVCVLLKKKTFSTVTNADIPVPSRYLDEQYLWVDTLCIIQDDKSFVSLELKPKPMASIYSNAFLTIVVASAADANGGIAGFKETVRPIARAPRLTVTLKDGSVLGVCSRSLMLGHTIWSRRGWTFQERLLSYRTLTVTNQNVEWKCPCLWWQDSNTVGDVERFDDDGNSHVLRWYSATALSEHLMKATWPDFPRLTDLVHAYSRIQLTFPEDILRAFTGISTRLSRAFRGGFLYGIPVMYFDMGLLWTSGSMGARRRGAMNNSLLLPSWYVSQSL